MSVTIFIHVTNKKKVSYTMYHKKTKGATHTDNFSDANGEIILDKWMAMLKSLALG